MTTRIVPPPGSATDRIRARYGRGRSGKTYAAIAAENGVSRQLVHAALSHYPLPLPHPRPSPMHPFVARFPTEQLEACREEARRAGMPLEACREEARRAGMPLGAWLRDVLVWYLDSTAKR